MLSSRGQAVRRARRAPRQGRDGGRARRNKHRATQRSSKTKSGSLEVGREEVGRPGGHARWRSGDLELEREEVRVT